MRAVRRAVNLNLKNLVAGGRALEAGHESPAAQRTWPGGQLGGHVRGFDGARAG